uniref:Uncharacterized protein n=1 Tax=Siphoviridae sp. ctBLh2 TaxID=2827803 RepID=A0A8S5S391_9CAUD|nr:MAG TPA: hypothetical protein [Siphoviridae sp. ctBLh2]
MSDPEQKTERNGKTARRIPGLRSPAATPEKTKTKNTTNKIQSIKSII